MIKLEISNHAELQSHWQAFIDRTRLHVSVLTRSLILKAAHNAAVDLKVLNRWHRCVYWIQSIITVVVYSFSVCLSVLRSFCWAVAKAQRPIQENSQSGIDMPCEYCNGLQIRTYPCAVSTRPSWLSPFGFFQFFMNISLENNCKNC